MIKINNIHLGQKANWHIILSRKQNCLACIKQRNVPGWAILRHSYHDYLSEKLSRYLITPSAHDVCKASSFIVERINTYINNKILLMILNNYCLI